MNMKCKSKMSKINNQITNDTKFPDEQSFEKCQRKKIFYSLRVWEHLAKRWIFFFLYFIGLFIQTFLMLLVYLLIRFILTFLYFFYSTTDIFNHNRSMLIFSISSNLNLESWLPLFFSRNGSLISF